MRPGCFLSVICLASIAALCSFVIPAIGDDYPVPEGLRPVRHPSDNQPTPEKVALGRQLFFDPRLSSTETVSCATCHDPTKGWSNGARFATGIDGLVGGRSAPTIINSAYNRFNFWDGRASDLEHQALGPIQNEIEMNMTLEGVVERLNAVEGYRNQFQAVFGTEVTSDGIAQAIACYERTILSGDAPYDRYEAGDESAMSEAAIRGRDLFFDKANCSACHVGPNFTDNAFHNIGIGMEVAEGLEPDWGRYTESELEGDRGSFKTPTLREIARTAPYMHDGSLATLEDVIEHYSKGGTPNQWLDEELFEIDLTAEEKADLVAFLVEGLSSESYPMDTPPELPE